MRKPELALRRLREEVRAQEGPDECYTPPHVFDAVLRWVGENVMPLDGVNVVRPFYPGGDYQAVEYGENDVVIDNPPFSILAEIRKYYQWHGVRYFLFAPALTLFASPPWSRTETFIVCGAKIIYENKKAVCTSFVTNMFDEELRVLVSGGLYRELDMVLHAHKTGNRRPRIELPPEVITAARLQKIAVQGIDLKIPKDECHFTRGLEAMRQQGKGLFGGGYLVSRRLAAEKLEAEKAAEKLEAEKAAEKAAEMSAAVQTYSLGREEISIVESLGGG